MRKEYNVSTGELTEHEDYPPRDDELLMAKATFLGLTDEQVDSFFETGKTL